eukprot:CAMPEP_0172468342 /NCGR_PEP_ID=MMETSP1065-20121228/61040_1 /TAXON_ID=265537 /ORGANISM="Amphiprora paludosa, Strain CCMP125" /LENGTH=54 /DNA_ID=CAMNT_0013225707 /DNA_START=16 /DNA_END=177 /DNA_ORIENTATION=+
MTLQRSATVSQEPPPNLPPRRTSLGLSNLSSLGGTCSGEPDLDQDCWHDALEEA